MLGGEHCVKISGTSNGLGFMVFLRFGGKGLLTELISDGGVCRTARATPGLLIRKNHFFFLNNKKKIGDGDQV